MVAFHMILLEYEEKKKESFFVFLSIISFQFLAKRNVFVAREHITLDLFARMIRCNCIDTYTTTFVLLLRSLVLC